MNSFGNDPPVMFENVCFSHATKWHPAAWRKLMSHERHGVSNHRQINCLFDSLFQANIKENIKTLHCSPFVRGVNKWPMFFLAIKVPVMPKAIYAQSSSNQNFKFKFLLIHTLGLNDWIHVSYLSRYAFICGVFSTLNLISPVLR